MSEPYDANAGPSVTSKGAFDIVGLAASAGGLRVLSEILAALPADFSAAIVIVQHLDPRHRSLMADILNRRTALHVEEAREGTRLSSGTAYIAPPNRHLLVNSDGTLSLSQSELVDAPISRLDLLICRNTMMYFNSETQACILARFHFGLRDRSDSRFGGPARR